MRKYITISVIIILSLGIISCEKLIEPKLDNGITKDLLEANPIFAEGILMRAYYNLPNDYLFETDIASDDAVSNDPVSSYRNMATGSWRSTNNPISQWNTANENIFYLNHFLSIYQDVNWSTDPNLSAAKNILRNTLHKKRLKGEAYGLRAWYKWRLLQYHGGMTEDGRLLGFPIIDEYITPSDSWTIPRGTFALCVKSIFNDLDTAIKYLPAKYVTLADADANATSGARFVNRINGNAAIALKARVALLAASPAFSASSGVTWDQAATFAGPLLKTLMPLDANGVTYYTVRDSKEIIWNRSELSKRTWEQSNFPPSLYGSGRTNPTQNLVDSYGMKNGYPIADLVNSTYDPTKPYTNRDPRLAKYVVYNAATFKGGPISTYSGAANDGINVLLTSTRTGYYLKKFMNENVKLDPSSALSQLHNFVLFRMTELVLNYAEAANEAWGPDGDPNGNGFTAKTLIAALRTRGGITTDAYLTSISDAAGLRTLIRNERRIELCFEGFRFWDIRRWNDITAMKAPVSAAIITNNAGTFTYSYILVEERKFEDNMIFGPIPYNETLKYNLDQNKGW